MRSDVAAPFGVFSIAYPYPAGLATLPADHACGDTAYPATPLLPVLESERAARLPRRESRRALAMLLVVMVLRLFVRDKLAVVSSVPSRRWFAGSRLAAPEQNAQLSARFSQPEREILDGHVERLADGWHGRERV